MIRGTVRCFSTATQHRIHRFDRRKISEGTARTNGAQHPVKPQLCLPGNINSVAETDPGNSCRSTAAGADKVDRDCVPSMASEDFAFMLNKKPGAYIWLGVGLENRPVPLHSPHYDFNDDALELGTNYWIALVHSLMEAPSS